MQQLIEVLLVKVPTMGVQFQFILFGCKQDKTKQDF